MIEEIRISSLGVIDSSTLELGPGLTVITGETGAGKTMVVTALGLLLGGRADTGAVRKGARAARVEGVVDSSGLSAFVRSVEECGGEAEDDRVLLARNISAEGRSRAFVGGASVPVAQLSDVTDGLVAVHGQSDQHRLLRPSAQRNALDLFGGKKVAQPAQAWTRLHRELGEVETELADVVASARERAREADLLRFGLEEIAAVDPASGEDVELAAEESRLGFADTLRTAAEQAREALSSDTGSPDALATTGAAKRLLESVREHDPAAAELADRLTEVTHLLNDVAADVASYAAGLDIDPNRLAAVSERRATLTALTRKYGESIDEVLAWAGEASRKLVGLDGTDDRIAELRSRRGELRAELAKAGRALSVARAAAAMRLGKVVSDELTLLAMPHAVVTVDVRRQVVEAPADNPEQSDQPGAPVLIDEQWVRCSPHGIDDVEILLAANTGADPRPLHKGASGGELSRVMLAIEVALAETSPVPTFVFDEVDAGVGGKAAVEVGRRLAQLARNSQVLVVTHLPQVAAYADHHVVVAKSSDGTVTTSGLTRLGEDDRVRELSRMLAGMEESESALAHAEELLATARAARVAT
ncbi:DNA repair protein RecN (Recombination protein N) [Nocardioides daedukensis]|uniref:DNA repair protein RecN n=1 Tax=Nocardioides daedukensis TaxID=634462 RepID=A0A7Y9RY05_9ACTN|nr:DNA repair protein RecN (Recombination protein N) [Nocardioides daedukensis]